MEISADMLAKILDRHPNKAIVTADGNTIYALWKGEVVIFTAEDESFNDLTEPQLATFIRKNAGGQWEKALEGGLA